jgi:hypothetical protein
MTYNVGDKVKVLVDYPFSASVVKDDVVTVVKPTCYDEEQGRICIQGNNGNEYYVSGKENYHVTRVSAESKPGSTYRLEFRGPGETDEDYRSATYQVFDTVEDAAARHRISNYAYRIVEHPDASPVVVAEYPYEVPKPVPAEVFEVGETYAHVDTPEDFQYKIVHEWSDGSFLLVYETKSTYELPRKAQVEYAADKAKHFIKKV